jgi:hypothetical protein
MRGESEGSGGFQRGTKREFGKRELYTATALLVMVFMVAGTLFAVPAWSQGDRTTSEE